MKVVRLKATDFSRDRAPGQVQQGPALRQHIEQSQALSQASWLLAQCAN